MLFSSSDHLDAPSLEHLGAEASKQANSAQAEDLSQRALLLREREQGVEHADLIPTLTALGKSNKHGASMSRRRRTIGGPGSFASDSSAMSTPSRLPVLETWRGSPMSKEMRSRRKHFTRKHCCSVSGFKGRSM